MSTQNFESENDKQQARWESGSEIPKSCRQLSMYSFLSFFAYSLNPVFWKHSDGTVTKLVQLQNLISFDFKQLKSSPE